MRVCVGAWVCSSSGSSDDSKASQFCASGSCLARCQRSRAHGLLDARSVTSSSADCPVAFQRQCRFKPPTRIVVGPTVLSIGLTPALPGLHLPALHTGRRKWSGQVRTALQAVRAACNEATRHRFESSELVAWVDTGCRICCCCCRSAARGCVPVGCLTCVLRGRTACVTPRDRCCLFFSVARWLRRALGVIACCLRVASRSIGSRRAAVHADCIVGSTSV